MKGKRITATDLIFGVSMCAAILLYLSRIRMGMAAAMIPMNENFLLSLENAPIALSPVFLPMAISQVIMVKPNVTARMR